MTIIAIVNIDEGTIKAADEPEQEFVMPMYQLWQNHTGYGTSSFITTHHTKCIMVWLLLWYSVGSGLTSVGDTLFVETVLRAPRRTWTTFIGVLPGLNNIANIGAWYSARHQRVYVWYSTDMGDRIAMATLGDVGIIGTPAVYIDAPSYMRVYDYTTFSFGGPNRMYDIDGLLYMYFGAAGSAAC